VNLKREKKLNKKTHCTAKEASTILGLTRSMVLKLCRDGKLPRSYLAHGPEYTGKRGTWAIDKNSLKKYKAARDIARSKIYTGVTFPHLRFIKYCAVWEGFDYELSKLKCKELGLPYIPEQDHAALSMSIHKIVSDNDKDLAAALKHGITQKKSFDNPSWQKVFKTAGISELFDDIDIIPWEIFNDNMARWTMECAFAHMTPLIDVHNLMSERYGYEFDMKSLGYFNKYFCEFGNMTELDYKVYFGRVIAREKKYKEGLINISPEIFRNKVGIDEEYETSQVLDKLAKKAEEMAFLVSSSVSKDDVDSEKNVRLLKDYAKAIKDYRTLCWNAEDRSGGVAGARKAAEDAIKLKYEISEDKKAVPIDEIKEKIMSSKPKEKNANGESAG